MTTPQQTILLIGGGGYVGCAVTPFLLRRGYRIRNLDNAIYAHGLSTAAFAGESSYEIVSGDIRRPEQIAAALDGVDHVVLLAGLVGDPITKTYPELSRAINDDGYRAAIDVCAGRGLKRVVFVSTCSNYGLLPEGEIADEATRLSPLSLYAKAKVATESYLLDRASSVDYTATVLRFATAFGLSPRMRFDLTLNEFTRELALGNELLVYDPDTWRPYCHVADFARLIATVLEAPEIDVTGEVFNAGADRNNYTKRAMVDLIQSLVGEGSVTYVEAGSDPRNYRVDFSKAQRRLGFEAAMTVEDGVREIIDAIGRGFFHTLDPKTFYGNYVIDDTFA
jgi:nucleoside-diphosphate-sugar epimerase